MSRNKYTASSLQEAMGAPNGLFHATPPHEHEWFLDRGTPTDRVVAFTWAHTIAIDFMCPWAIGERDRALWIEDYAAALGWAVQTARNVLVKAQHEGRIRLDHKRKRVYLCALVVAQESPDNEHSEGRREREDFNFVQRFFGGEVVDSIRNLPELKQRIIFSELKPYFTYRTMVEAETWRAMRADLDPIGDSILRKHGIEKQRNGARKPEPKVVRLEVADFEQWKANAQSYDPECTNECAEENAVTHPLVVLDSDSEYLDIGCSSSSSPPVEGTTTTTTAPDFDPTAPLNKTLFHQELAGIFGDAGKPVPTEKQTARAFRDLPPDARGFYLEDLRRRIAGAISPGILLTDVPAFSRAWPRVKTKREAEWKQRQEFLERSAKQRMADEQRADEFEREMLRAAMDPYHPDHEFAKQYRGEKQPMKARA